MLMSLASSLGVNLFGAIDRLMQDAETPHFMQMHSGALDMSKLKIFAEENDCVGGLSDAEFPQFGQLADRHRRKFLVGNLQDNGFAPKVRDSISCSTWTTRS